MKTKDKPGVETWEKLAVCKVNGAELKYEEGNVVGLKKYLTRLKVDYDNPLDYFDIIDNPYKNVPRCHCKICNKVFKDEGNKSGMLTAHIVKKHNVEIKNYLVDFPNESYLFNTQLIAINKENYLMESDDNRIQCPICKEWFKAIKQGHTKLHGMTPTEFKKFTGLDSLLSKNSSDKAREAYFSENGMFNKNGDERRDSIKQYLVGVDYTTYDPKELRTKGVHLIYRIISPSGKCYIGRTDNFFQRILDHRSNSNTGKTYVIYDAIRKYKWENMTIEIIDICIDKEDAVQKELKWIIFFDSYINGYNSTLNTEGGHRWQSEFNKEQHRKYVQESLEKITSKTNKYSLSWYVNRDGSEKGTKLYEKRCEKLREISYSQRGYQTLYAYMDEDLDIKKKVREPKPKKIKEKIIKPKVKRVANNLGIPMSEETKQRMKEKAKGRYTLEWFIKRDGEEQGKINYQARVTKLANRTDQARDSQGNFIKRV